MKDYYALLAVTPEATLDDIKRAFRREIARYHPDKVHHLGQEFQALAAERAAELTEAYRVLMDTGLRSSYDQERGIQRPAEPAPGPVPPSAPAEEARPSGARVDREPAPRAAEAEPAPPKRPAPDGSNTFVRRMAMNRFSAAIERALPGVASLPARGFELGYLVKGKRSLFGKAVPERLLAAYLGDVTAGDVAALGQKALAARGTATLLTVFALGDRMGPAPEISAAVSSLKRKVPAGVTLTVVPVDVRDWSAMMPKDASATIRAVIGQLTATE